MQALVETAMRQGAFGVSTGLIYQPGSLAKTPELIAPPRRRRSTEASTPPTCARGETDRRGPGRAFTIAREARIPVEIWHLKVAGRSNWGRMKEVVARIERRELPDWM